MITKDPGKAGELCLGLYLHLHTGIPGNSVSALHESRNLKQARPDSGQSVDLLHTEGACYSLTGNSPVQEYTLYEHEFQEKNRDQDREWDSYRNHTIGFVLQNYNLIPHQTILSNVELVLTISGVRRAQRKQRAMDALAQVGLTAQISEEIQSQMSRSMSQIGSVLADAMTIDTDALLSAFTVDMDISDLSDILSSLTASGSTTYEDNLATLGYTDFSAPDNISFYPTDFESKDKVIEILDDYNDRMEAAGEDDKVITFTDSVGSMMSMVTEIVNILSYVLIAFVAISLLVSSIMIGVITCISVLERKQEIGILRAIGASRRNISQVFNAETGIIGFAAGLLGIVLTLVMIRPINMVIHNYSGITELSAHLPSGYAVILILLSVALTLLSGMLPSRKASRSDPVEALRTE